jgi:flavin reductase (DIM6/NTAB) family NADH-FMN oxidoreductase RutF
VTMAALPLSQFDRAIHPRPAFLVTVAGSERRPNVLAVATLTSVSYAPPILSFSIRPERYSYQLLQENPAFVVNAMTFEWATEVNFCGHCSGRDVDKFALTGLTPVPAQVVSVPAIAEAAAHVECEVEAQYPAGAYVLVLGRVVAVLVREGVLDGKYRNLASAAPLFHILSSRYTTSSGHFVEPDPHQPRTAKTNEG